MKKLLLLFAVISIVGLGYRKEGQVLEWSKNVNSTTTLVKEGGSEISSIMHEGMVKLGAKLNNPYTVQNMQEAYKEFIADSPEYKNDDLSIETSHYYIRFQPKNSLEIQELEEKNKDLEFFYYPLDYEILEGGTFYHDPTLADNEFTWMYTVIEKRHPIPDIKHEVLAELYIPELLEERNDPVLSEDSKFVTLLVNYALERTGNLEKSENTKIAGWFSSWIPSKWTQKGIIRVHNNMANTIIKFVTLFVNYTIERSVYLKKSDNAKITDWFSSWVPPKWTPKGTIRVHDDVANTMIKLPGVKVRARRWFIIKTGHTNEDGYFTTGGFRRPVNYSIKWRRNYYNISVSSWVANFYTATYNGPKKKEAWNLDIRKTAESFNYAHIHRGAHRYFYKNIGGLKRPNLNFALRIICINENGGGLNVGNKWMNYPIITYLAFPNIKIWTKRNGVQKDSQKIFGTTLHEIGHSSHIELMNAGLIQYLQVEPIIYESWANAIEWYLMRMEYQERGFPDFADANISNECCNREWSHDQKHDKNLDKKIKYAPIFIDMVDHFNQSIDTCIDANQPIDKCPYGGIFNGEYCYWGAAPVGVSGFIYAGHFYQYPEAGNTCVNSNFPNIYLDEENHCYLTPVPTEQIGHIWHNSSGTAFYYTSPSGNTNYPYDEISGYTMGDLENDVIKYTYGLHSLKTKLKANKPVGVTDKEIDLYLSYY